MPASVPIIFLLWLGYATLRYNVLGTVAWQEFPVYVANKAVSAAAVTLLVAAYLTRRPGRPRIYGIAGFLLMLVHLVLSLLVFDPQHYPKILSAGGLTPAGWWSITAGVVASLLLCGPFWASRQNALDRLGEARWRAVQRVGYLALALCGIHTAALGVSGWLRPSTWPGGLPPITLLTTTLALCPLVLRVRKK